MVAILCSAAGASSAPSQTATWGVAARAELLTAAGKALRTYFFTSRVPRLRAALEAHRNALLRIGDPEKFAKAVTADLYAVAHDKHVALFYSTTTIPTSSTGKPTPADIAYIKHDEAFGNYGYASALRLWGNIGYLHLYFFSGMPEARQTIDAAMALLAHTDAMIIDLRDNEGGNPNSIDYLMGYFFPKPTQLTSIIWRQNGKTTTHRQFSAATVSGARYLGRPIYVLIDHRTISGGEQFAYDMKTLHRATLIGATTAGGANPGEDVRLSAHFMIFVPHGQARNPYTGTNWEGVGVIPDIKIAPETALLKAYVLALRAVNDPFDDAVQERQAALKDPAAALRESLPEISRDTGGIVP